MVQNAKKKLIEVALPLEAINREAAREKSIRHGHPSTLHLWWARRPLAACRAVIFASLVDDPSAHPDQFPTQEAQDKERERLFAIIERLVKWENSNDEDVLGEAHKEVLKSTDGNPPRIYDPFCGGGSIPLEAQRLGLKAYGSDLNPVAVLITKALIEIPPKFAGRAPVNPEDSSKPLQHKWRGARGLAADIRYYGQWVRNEAERQIGSYYPKVKRDKEVVSDEGTVVAWIWARTVQCPNPACGAEMPLISSFWLSSKKGSEAWIDPIIDKQHKTIRFTVKSGRGQPMAPSKLSRGAKFKCLCCGESTSEDYIKTAGSEKKIGKQLLAIVSESSTRKEFHPPTQDHIEAAEVAIPQDVAEAHLAHDPRNIWCVSYGLSKFRDLFSARQLLALNTFALLIKDVSNKILEDATRVGFEGDGATLENGGAGALAYAEAVATYLGCALSRCADFWSTLATWTSDGGFITHAFRRQAIPMVWDYAEGNPFSNGTGNWMGAIDWVVRCVVNSPAPVDGRVAQMNATHLSHLKEEFVFCTDPPYYDNISYADLSDYFYVWLRVALSNVYPKLFETLMVPKGEELVASPYRFNGSKDAAGEFFEAGLAECFHSIREKQNPQFPFTVYYAFKQSESDGNTGESQGNRVSTGWETMLEGLIQAGFQICGTIPLRTERSVRSIAVGTNALASSIVLVCRQREVTAQTITRREFVNCLAQELPSALDALKKATIAATDLAQAAIGPGMAVFSRYSKVMEADGAPMSVRMALALINQVLDEVNSEGEGDFDPDSRWAVSWFETHGFEEGAYGEAETLSKAKNTSTSGLVDAGIITSKAGKVRLIPIEDLPKDWDPNSDNRLTVWEVTHHLIRILETKGEEAAATLMREVGPLGEVARDLAYRLYSICERRKWAKDALRYNGLIVAWSDVSKVAQSLMIQGRSPQMTLIV